MLIEETQNIMKNCSMCSSEINLKKHLDGLVINSLHFVCKDCCMNTDKQVLAGFCRDKAGVRGSVRPIMLWLWNK